MQDSGAFGIFLGRSSWTANEEVRLLDAIEQFGFGNWEDIAKHIETRSPEGKLVVFSLKSINFFWSYKLTVTDNNHLHV